MGEGEGEGAVKVDLTHALNRVTDTWFDLFTGDVKKDMPELACAFPGDFSQLDQEHVRNASTHVHYSLRWNMNQKATDSAWETRRLLSSIGWDLKVGWIGLQYEQEGQKYQFIDDAHAYVEITDPSKSLTLYVKGKFSHPSFVGNDASLPVYFNVVVKDESTTLRDDSRAWTIFADGHNVRIE